MICTKNILITALSLAFHILPSLQHSGPYFANGQYPNRTLGGVTVLDTPLIRAAEELTRLENNEITFRHNVRAWLFGVLIIQNNKELQSVIDLEVHAVSSLLHDLGLSRRPGNTIVTPDRRFEVDGAIAAREFVNVQDQLQNWDARQVQLMWDAIALHTEPTFYNYKEPEVQLMANGTSIDFIGPVLGVTLEQYNQVVQEFPKGDWRGTTNETIIWLCATKPFVTYDTWLQPWGDRYVANYSAAGKRRIDNLLEGPFVNN